MKINNKKEKKTIAKRVTGIVLAMLIASILISTSNNS
jgi:hypothetical protein|tara:strand:+ start:117 stop:227 length:111 start_codon:yes stop_codon:yes gene_type:complete